MSNNSISIRYAKALFELALEQNKMEEIQKDVLQLKQVLKDSDELRLILNIPNIKTEDKKKALFKFLNNSQELTKSFINTVFTKHRGEMLESMCKQFHELYQKHKNIKRAVVVSSVELSEKQKKDLTDKLAKKYDSQIILETKTDPSLIGGFMVRVDDELLDNSIRSKINRMKNQLILD